MPDSQHPYPGWLWYQPTMFSNRPTFCSDTKPCYLGVDNMASMMSPRCMCAAAAAAHLACFCKVNNILIGFSLCIDSSFCSLYREGKDIHNYEGVIKHFALQHPHDLKVPAGFRVHCHLEQGKCRDLHTEQYTAS